MVRQKIVTVQYNGTVMKLAPHMLFERHGDLFVSALNLDKKWLSEDDRRLGHFKLSGLKGIDLEEEAFDPLPSYAGTVPGPKDTLVFSV